MNTNEIAKLTAGQTVEATNIMGTSTYTVISNDGVKIAFTNPDAGQVYGNYNASPKALTFKLTSKTLAARFRDAKVI